jgi:hypothetical protein
MDHDAGRRFIQREGRVLEQRLAATLFDGAAAQGVVDAVRAYRNPDGGFGHGLEPDKRVPNSQPLDVEVAFDALAAAGRFDQDLAIGACDFLATIGPGVACVLPNIAGFPLASHWEEGAFEEPGLNPTSRLVAHLLEHGIDHPWVEAATAYCWAELEGGLPREAHTLDRALHFLAAVSDRERAEKVMADWPEARAEAQWLKTDPTSPDYGVSPLDIIPTPDHRWRWCFEDAVYEGFLDALDAGQQADGGWPIAWEPPGHASPFEWRGLVTLDALVTLRAWRSL